MLAQGADPDVKDSDGVALLHLAAQGGYSAIVASLISRGAYVDCRDIKFDATPLYMAAMNGHGETAEHLLNGGADADAKNGIGATPLHVAAHQGHADVIRILLKHGADPKIRSQSGKRAVDFITKQEIIPLFESP